MSNSDWGAIPRQLAEDVSLTLKQKFNVQTGFKPVEWNKNIKALTPFPEKTVSGSVVSFSDGADDVPIKSANFGILASGGGGTPSTPVPIVGKSSVTVYQTGKNIFDFAGNINSTSGGFTFTALSDGGISYTGTATGTWCYMTPKVDCFIPAGTQLTFSRNQSLGYRHYLNIGYDDGGTRSLIIDDTSVTYTLPKNVVALRLVMSQLTAETSYSATVYFMLEVGATPSAFQKYKSKTPITVALGQTVYGGTLTSDGTLTITHALVPFSDCTWAGVTSYQSNFNADNGIVSLRFGKSAMASAGYAQKVSTALCNIFDNQSRSVWNNASRLYEIGYTDGITFNVHYSDIGLSEWTSNATDTKNAFMASSLYSNGYFALELATPIVITGLDEISLSTYLSDNSIWADTGDSSVVYRSNVPNFETVLSSSPLIEITGVSGTDVQRNIWSYTATSKGKIKFHSNTQVKTNTGANDGYFIVKKNDSVIISTYANTSTTTQFPIPDIDVESGDVVTIIGGFDNYHTSCWFDIYSTIVILKLD